MSGVKEECRYNVIPSFHVSKNVFCDIVHDPLEGVCRYVMLKVVKYLTVSKHFFLLDKLNQRISTFNFDHSSQPVYIARSQLKGHTLVTSAVEMPDLVLAFGLMVGDLVTEGDDCWEVYLLMRKVVVFSCWKRFSNEDLVYMRILIAKFLAEYTRVYGCSLSLKFHNLTVQFNSSSFGQQHRTHQLLVQCSHHNES